MRYDARRGTIMSIPFKDIIGVGERLLSTVRSKEKKAEQDRFEHGKQEFLMEWLTVFRKNPGANGMRPMPGTLEFEYCEALTRDGALRRDIITGMYCLKVGDDEHGMYGPNLY